MGINETFFTAKLGPLKKNELLCSLYGGQRQTTLWDHLGGTGTWRVTESVSILPTYYKHIYLNAGYEKLLSYVDSGLCQSRFFHTSRAVWELLSGLNLMALVLSSIKESGRWLLSVSNSLQQVWELGGDINDQQSETSKAGIRHWRVSAWWVPAQASNNIPNVSVSSASKICSSYLPTSSSQCSQLDPQCS